MKIERADGLAWRTIDQETFVVDLRNKWMYGLNGSAGIVWQAIVAGETFDVIVRRLALSEDTSWPAQVVENSLTVFLQELAEIGLIVGLNADLRPENCNSPDGYEAPALTWNEELKAFAQSCTFDNFNCADQVITT